MKAFAVTAVVACSLAGAQAVSAPAYPGCAPGPDLHLRAADGTRLVGHRFGKGKTAVVLAHQYAADLCQWAPYAQRLVGLGYRVIAFDFRGFGRSQHRPPPAGLRYDLDVAAAVAEARREGAARVVVVGASIGGNAAIVAAAEIRPPIAGVVSLSGPGTFRLDAVSAAKRLKVPALYLAAEVDEGGIYATDAKTMYTSTPVADKALAVVPGSAHGVALVAGPGRARRLVERFIGAHAAG